MSERRSDRWLSILLSVLVHAAIVGAIFWGWWQFRTPRPMPQALTIEGTVVRGQPPSPPPAPTPAPQPQPPAPDAAAARAAEQQQLEAQQAAQKRAAEQHEAQQREAEQRAEEQREREAADQKRAEQERAVKEEAERQAQEAELKAKQEAERKAQEVAERKSAQERAVKESDLQSQLAAEEHLNAVRASGEQAEYAALIRARIERAWIRPPSAHAGIDCVVHVTQVPGGAVTAVQVGSCNGDQALRESIEAAVYRASPLPAPPDPALFERELVVNFRPSD